MKIKRIAAAALSVLVMGGTMPVIQLTAPVMTSFAEEEYTEVKEEGMTFHVYSDHAVFCGSDWDGDYDGNLEMIIPSEVSGVPVTVIEPNWSLSFHFKVTSVVIPDTVKEIGQGSFYNFVNLENVIIPENVTSIGKWAFAYCTNLSTITIQNPDCQIDDSENTISNGYDEERDKDCFKGTIRGYEGSTAQAYAEKYGYTFEAIHEGPVVSVTISDGEGGLPLIQEPVEVTDIDNDGSLTINDVLWLAHEEHFEGGAAAGYFITGTETWGLAIKKLWGKENGWAFGYYHNDDLAMTLTDEIQDGDWIYAFVLSDTKTYSDTYSFFTPHTAQVRVGEPLELTLNAGGFGGDGRFMVLPLSADITINGNATDYKSDEDGKVTVSFDEPGEYIVGAVSEEKTLVPPVCKVTVSESVSGIKYGDVNSDGSVNLNDAVAILQYVALSAKYPIEGDALEAADVFDNGTSGINGQDALVIMMVDAGLLDADKLPVTSKDLK